MKTEINHMIAVVKSDCLPRFTGKGCYWLLQQHVSCYQVNAEAHTTPKRAAMRRLYVFLWYRLHAGYI